MAQIITSINTASDTFGDLVDKVNEIALVITNDVITANSTTANTNGNTQLIGTFGANTLVATNGIRGGNVSTSANLVISSNVTIQGQLTLTQSITQNTSIIGDLTITSRTTTITNTNSNIIDSFAIASGKFAKYFIAVQDSGVQRHTIELSVMHDDTDVYISRYGEILTANLGSFSANIASGNVNILFNAAGANTSNNYVVKAARMTF